MKISLTLAGVALLGASLAACSGGGSDSTSSSGASGSYCKDVAAAKPVFDSLSQGDLAQLEKGFQAFHDLAAEAPAELKDEWKTLDSAVTTIEGALEDAGIKMSDLADIQSGKIPEGVDVTKLTGFATQLQELNNDEFTKARNAIGDQAKKTCDVDLGSL